MEKEQVEQFKENVKKNWLVMARVPDNIKKEFIDYSNAEFCGDYGLCLKTVWDQFKEYQFMKSQLFSNADIKLNHIIEILEKGKEPSKKEIKLLSGKSLKGGDKDE